MQVNSAKHILAFDTANEQITIAIGKFCNDGISLIESFECPAHRESNTKLLPNVKNIMDKHEISNNDIALVASGTGPGSFTGVRIALATAKGISTGLECGLLGINTLDAVAWNAWLNNIRGHIYVIADAMRHEIYPVLFKLTENGIERLNENKVMKAEKSAEEAFDLSNKIDNLHIAGDALLKYFEMFEGLNICDQKLWTPTGEALLKCIDSQISADKFDKESLAAQYQPGIVLPVYTRLSDAEEGEREKLSKLDEKNLKSGVQNLKASKDQITYKVLDANSIYKIAEIENQLMESDAWNAEKLSSDYVLSNRSWWYASLNNQVIGYAGAMQAADKMELLKIAVLPEHQHRGVAEKLISVVANDMRDLGAKSCILEVRASNLQAINFYKKINLEEISTRKQYYSNGEDALIMQGPLPIISKDIAGMDLQTDANAKQTNMSEPIIFSVESSCDETACAITTDGNVVSDVVASQIDFHKRFGGVVPEIASRKHIEAICGVADVCLEKSGLKWNQIQAVAVTYAPGLVGALVVGMAFAKGLAYALDVPFIGVNHLEGHMYANKLNADKIELPAIASLISGGNTMLVHVKDWGNYETLGTTIDDAVGEAFDKVAKYLGLGYPGGPIISKLAKRGNPKAINFPRAMLHSKDYKFSLSGLKTAVINYISNHQKDDDFDISDLCASFEQAIIDVQVAKAKEALIQTGAKSFMFGGGVAANPEIRSAFEKMCEKQNVELIMAPLSACGDNAAMIGLVATDRFKAKKFFPLSADVAAHANLDLAY